MVVKLQRFAIKDGLQTNLISPKMEFDTVSHLSPSDLYRTRPIWGHFSLQYTNPKRPRGKT